MMPPIYRILFNRLLKLLNFGSVYGGNIEYSAGKRPTAQKFLPKLVTCHYRRSRAPMRRLIRILWICIAFRNCLWILLGYPNKLWRLFSPLKTFHSYKSDNNSAIPDLVHISYGETPCCDDF